MSSKKSFRPQFLVIKPPRYPEHKSGSEHMDKYFKNLEKNDEERKEEEKRMYKRIQLQQEQKEKDYDLLFGRKVRKSRKNTRVYSKVKKSRKNTRVYSKVRKSRKSKKSRK
jgi:hypothetical protein